MIIGVAVQQPDDRLSYDITYTKWLDGNVDPIDTIAVEIVPNGLTLSATVAKVDDENATLWLFGGVEGDEAKAEITTTFASGRVKQDEVLIRIVEF